jgi:hypothetical protein
LTSVYVASSCGAGGMYHPKDLTSAKHGLVV